MFKKALFALSVLLIQALNAYQYDLAIVAISKNDENYLKEWIEFHKLVGVQHFYIFCHGDWENYQKILQSYIDSNEVDLLSTDSFSNLGNADEAAVFNTIQCESYTNLIVEVRTKVKWLAVIDTDEFLFSPLVDNLNDYLATLDNDLPIGALAVNWQMFGTSHVQTIPNNCTLIETLTYCITKNDKANQHIKSIIRPERVVKFENPHYPICFPGFNLVNTNLEPFAGPFSPSVLIDHLRLNHYWTRDMDFFQKYKVPRRLNWFNSKGFIEILDLRLNESSDDAILRFVPALRKSLNLGNEEKMND